MTFDSFMREPTREQWCQEIAEHHWQGPDGSSCSRDSIFGVIIGVKSARYEYHLLPANEHDWRYQLGRRFGLPWEWQQPVDEAYRDGCLKRIEVLGGLKHWIGVRDCEARYLVLRARSHLRKWFGITQLGGSWERV